MYTMATHIELLISHLLGLFCEARLLHELVLGLVPGLAGQFGQHPLLPPAQQLVRAVKLHNLDHKRMHYERLGTDRARAFHSRQGNGNVINSTVGILSVKKLSFRWKYRQHAVTDSTRGTSATATAGK